jgi:hypothetical protein
MFKTALLIMAAFFSINAYASVLERSARNNLTQQEELRTVAGDVLKVKYGRVRNSGGCKYIATYICESINGEACEEEHTRIVLNFDFSRGVRLVKSKVPTGVLFDLEKSEGLSVVMIATDGSTKPIAKIPILRSVYGDDVRQMVKDYQDADRYCYGLN